MFIFIWIGQPSIRRGLGVGIPGAVRACAMHLIHEFKVHSLLLLFSRAFYVYLLLFRSLQYIYESLYCSYPSVCLCRLQRQPESYSLSCSDHANILSLLIRFQHLETRGCRDLKKRPRVDFFGNERWANIGQCFSCFRRKEHGDKDNGVSLGSHSL